MKRVPLLEKKLQEAARRWSNSKIGPSEVKPEWIEEFAEHCKQSIIKQLKPRDEKYYHRASAMGKPLCQLQQAKAQNPKVEKDYSFIMKMLIGDMTEGIISLLAKIGKVPIVEENTESELTIDGETIRGTDDHTIDFGKGKKIYDTKTASGWAFKNKWSEGYSGLQSDDSFGYISQLFIYALGRGIDAGGWIVVNKESGEIKVVEVPKSSKERDRVVREIKTKLLALKQDWPFDRCFQPIDDKFNRKYTDSKYLGVQCSYCDFRDSCWPGVQRLPRPFSTAKEQTYRYYVRYKGRNLNEDTKRKKQRKKTATVGAKQTTRKVSRVGSG